MWSILALGAAERLVNRVIDLDAITRIQLNQLQGQLLRVVIASPQLSVDVFFDENILRLEPTATGHSETPSLFEQRPFDPQHSPSTANATLQVANVVELLKLLLNKEVGTIPVQGDFRLLQTLQDILQRLEPDLAAHLSPWVGPTLAHELGKIQHLPQLVKRSLQSKLFFAADTLKEDSGLFAPRWQMDELQQGTRALQQNIDRLEAKVQALQQKILPKQD
ncbi:hypothetical protein P255_00185 [Acinetobacter brisouii CIP 110357]|uniref:Ubiquinone biosynthesis accessory factor UbiJ n=1 Tax=Acinetobacter brisouii CIP 110357 TaxID=1341683 RepID=V2UEQ6_9GAMM|nr:hypothetical protein [Acinetobacter brisouii]ENV48674.1 hypothetical protein F954_00409 [Acinetobacter brisouii ANC 4119]ESK53073.1 hypothetical protein P255_00185 [Acinetobacter brisouii CIP 110357]